MNRLFFISGLPRSGTAWASALISLCPNAFCLHEGEAIHRWNLVRNLVRRSELFVGDSAPLAKAERFDVWTAGRVAIVRDLPDVKRASRKAFHGLISNDALDRDARRLDAWISLHSPLVIQFNDLFTIAGAGQVWNHLLPGQHFPEGKVAALTRTRVQQIIPSKSEIINLAQQLAKEV